MPISLSASETRRFRVLGQGLSGPDVEASSAGKAGVPGIARRAGGIQAQDMNAAALQIRVRSAGLTTAAMHGAISEDRSVVRTWAMRGTLHLIPAEDYDWIVALTGPPAMSAGRGRRLSLGLDEATLDRALTHAVDMLRVEGPMTRPQLAERLAAYDIPVADQGLNHIVRSGGFMGILCHGPLINGRTETFVAADAWLAHIARQALPRPDALAALALRHISAFGPAAPHDFATWSGLPLRDARSAWHAISDELMELTAADAPAWIARDDAPRLEQVLGDSPPAVRLLGAFDTYLLGYKGRDLAVAPRHASMVNAGGGMIRPVVILDGEAVGGWGMTRKDGGRAVDISVAPFEGMEGRLEMFRDALAVEAEDIGRFLGVEARLVAA